MQFRFVCLDCEFRASVSDNDWSILEEYILKFVKDHERRYNHIVIKLGPEGAL